MRCQIDAKCPVEPDGVVQLELSVIQRPLSADLHIFTKWRLSH